MSGQTEMALADRAKMHLMRWGSSASHDKVKMLAAFAESEAALRRPAPTEPDIRAAAFEECARHLEKSYPGHAWLNAACAAIRTRAALSPAGDTGREALLDYRMAQKWASGTAEHQKALAEADRLNPLPPWYEIASPLPAARIGRQEIAQTIYQSWFDSDPQTVDEHFRWYDNGKSNPDSCVHYSNVAKAIKAADAILTARDAGSDVAVSRAERAGGQS